MNTTGAIRNAATIQTGRDLVLLVARVGLGVMMLAHAKLEYDHGGSLAGWCRRSSSRAFRCQRLPGRPTCSEN